MSHKYFVMENIINQLFEIEKKAKNQNITLFERNLERINYELEEMGYRIENPINRIYDERDNSIQANLMSNNATTITKVIKPIIYQKQNGTFVLIQKGIVIVE